MIAVEDKNYENIDAVELHTGLDHRIDETMNFGSYVKKLFYVMYNLDTGERVLLPPSARRNRRCPYGNGLSAR